MMKKYLFSFVIIAGLAFTAQAQKYGFINSGNLLQEFSKTENLDAQLETFSQPLLAKGQDMIEKLKANTQSFYDEVNKGVLSQVAIQQRQTALQQEEQSITTYEKEVQQKILTKREEIFNPVLERVQKAIDEVAKENGYTMIFDSSVMNALLFTNESDNIEPAVRAKLGI